MNRKFESVEDDAGKVTRYLRHSNGGGLVAPGAYVAENARVGSMTYVEPGAYIGSGSRVGHGSWIDREARVGDRTVIGDGVYVGHGTVIGNRVHIGSHSRIGAGALIGHGTRLHADTTVPESGRVTSDSKRRRRVTAEKHPPRRPQHGLAA